VSWLPKGFDPAFFDAERATQRLQRVSARASKRIRRGR
jgi:hypothetical protein